MAEQKALPTCPKCGNTEYAEYGVSLSLSNAQGSYSLYGDRKVVWARECPGCSKG
jgi:hypothetical protein